MLAQTVASGKQGVLVWESLQEGFVSPSCKIPRFRVFLGFRVQGLGAMTPEPALPAQRRGCNLASGWPGKNNWPSGERVWLEMEGGGGAP